MTLPESMQSVINDVSTQFRHLPRLPQIFAATFANTYLTTLQPQPDGSTFVITGDIPAMWLRDSAAQVRPYLGLAKADPAFAALIAGVVRRQMQFVLQDPYANAFNATANGQCHNKDQTEMSDWIWERKYELDSLCAPIRLAHDLWRATGQTDFLDEDFLRAARLIVATMQLEQRHENSRYRFQRPGGPPSDTLTHDGRGDPVGYTGMTWSGFRPSDDACRYNYLVPANMMAVVALQNFCVLPLADAGLLQGAADLAKSIRAGIETHAKVHHPEFGLIYA